MRTTCILFLTLGLPIFANSSNHQTVLRPLNGDEPCHGILNKPKEKARKPVRSLEGSIRLLEEKVFIFGERFPLTDAESLLLRLLKNHRGSVNLSQFSDGLAQHQELREKFSRVRWSVVFQAVSRSLSSRLQNALGVRLPVDWVRFDEANEQIFVSSVLFEEGRKTVRAPRAANIEVERKNATREELAKVTLISVGPVSLLPENRLLKVHGVEIGLNERQVYLVGALLKSYPKSNDLRQYDRKWGIISTSHELAKLNNRLLAVQVLSDELIVNSQGEFKLNSAIVESKHWLNDNPISQQRVRELVSKYGGELEDYQCYGPRVVVNHESKSIYFLGQALNLDTRFSIVSYQFILMLLTFPSRVLSVEEIQRELSPLRKPERPIGEEEHLVTSEQEVQSKGLPNDLRMLRLRAIEMFQRIAPSFNSIQLVEAPAGSNFETGIVWIENDERDWRFWRGLNIHQLKAQLSLTTMPSPLSLPHQAYKLLNLMNSNDPMQADDLVDNPSLAVRLGVIEKTTLADQMGLDIRNLTFAISKLNRLFREYDPLSRSLIVAVDENGVVRGGGLTTRGYAINPELLNNRD